MAEKKKVTYRINAGLMIVILLGIIIFVNLISTRHYKRFDLTKNKLYTLSPQTKKIVKNLKDKIEIYAFFKETSEMKNKARDILEQYKSISPKISYQFIDPDRRPEIARKYNITTYGTILIKKGKDYEKVYTPEEKEITTAILKLTKKGKKKIYFTTGHGEKDIDEFGKGISKLKNELEDEQYEVEKVVLMRKGIPEDCDILVICGPEIDFMEKEVEEIKKYVNNGGRLLVFLDPGNFPVLEKFLKNYGVEADNDIVIDLASRRFLGDATTPMITDYPYHEITKDFNLASIFSWARSVEPESNLPKDITCESIAKTSQASWAEKNMKSVEKGVVKFDKGIDKPGPVSVSVAVEKEIKKGKGKKKGRIVVFGDSDFVSDKFINFSGNKDFALNTFNWLAEEEVLISIRSKKEKNQPLILSEKQGKIIFFIPVVILPLLVFLTGSFVYLKRRYRY